MDNNQARQAIIDMEALSGLNTGLRAKIADIFLNIGVPQRIAAGATIYNRGDASDDQGIVLLEGEIAVRKEGNPEIIAYAPDLIGEMAQLNPTKQRTATVVAETELQVLRFSWPSFTKSAEAALSQDELNAFTNGLQEYAWKHFTQ